MTEYKFYGDDILKLERNGKVAFVDLTDFSMLKESDCDDKKEFKQCVEDLFGCYGILDKLDW